MARLRLRLPDGRLTNAALLLLGDEDALAERLPVYGYSYQFRPSAGSEATTRLRECRPLLSAIEVLIDSISARLHVHPLNLAGGVQLRLSDYPLDAVRELVVNGLLHRSYETDGTVDIEHTPEQLVITSLAAWSPESPPIAYGRRGADEIDQNVIDHVREYGFVTNRTIQRIFDIPLYGARNLLAEMRSRGLLEKIGDARGGPGVRYGPGPEFPD